LFVYVTLEGGNSDAAIVLSLVLVVVSLVVLVSVYRWLSTP
jgi:ABC-type sulfate transport system permease component